MYGCGLNLFRVHDGENGLMEVRTKQRATSHTWGRVIRGEEAPQDGVDKLRGVAGGKATAHVLQQVRHGHRAQVRHEQPGDEKPT
jgi:hypothetical protein